MTIVEFARAFLHETPIAVVVTDAQPCVPGPVILYANPAFGLLTGRNADELVGLTPRFMQGRETRRSSLDDFGRALAAGERFHGFLTNYRADGTKYRVEIDCRSLRGPDRRPDYHIAFQREVVRRLGRPAATPGSRYEPVSVSNELITASFRALAVFSDL